MGLFKLFNRDKTEIMPILTGSDNNMPVQIPKELFIEENLIEDTTSGQQPGEEIQGIAAIYNFLQADYATNGYEDALANPEERYKEDQIKLMKLDLAIMIQKATTYYETVIKLIDLHMEMRSRSGLINLVEELKTRKEIAQDHITKLTTMKENMSNDTGLQERVFLSYQQGFIKGLIFLTQTNILDKKL